MADYKVPATPEAVAAQKARDKAAEAARSTNVGRVAAENAAHVSDAKAAADVYASNESVYDTRTAEWKAADAKSVAAKAPTLADAVRESVAKAAVTSAVVAKDDSAAAKEAALAAKEFAETTAAIAERHKDERFILVDRNKDGIFDAIDIVAVPWRADARRRAEAVEYNAYFQHIAKSRDNAAKEFAGKSAVEMVAIEKVVLARAKASWKGSVPPENFSERAALEAAREAAEFKAAVTVEVNNLHNPSPERDLAEISAAQAANKAAEVKTVHPVDLSFPKPRP